MRIAVAIAGLVVLAAVGGVLLVRLGLYDISATDQHLAPTYWLLDKAMRYSVRRRAADIRVPPLGAREQLERGGSLYRAHCERCHGGPGVAPAPFALGMTPLPVPLTHTARHWPAADVFWVVKEGIKMTGMPAWKYRMSDEDIWALVAFLPAMARMTPARYKAGAKAPAASPLLGNDPREMPPSAERGRRAVEQYGCVGCHAIPGVVGPNFPVGPPLAGVGSRVMLGGVLPNTPANMALWLRSPQSFAPASAMPNLGLAEQDARDIAAFLATLK